MYCATFIFKKKQFDDEFYQLDQSIAEFARQTTDYIGEETSENLETGCVSNMYYWRTMEGMQELMQHPKHLQAKAAQTNWLDGYQVVISQVLRCYGDGTIPHPTESFINS
ncbi:antibiotic biosynthesis monooxygenase [Solimicrobium silvestre]|uniref:Antibiotic biosynthesis monooxygenase n=1 Tax=Solimicrobium silvestre TaxID=2099400 RepID=A0A2S9H180_9BURK|nr:antibiotic biosynthesis monooxygenase [Solimicrobium silvestre]PRC93745.1 hypothetical protein S2091_1746 [Solimicrobium silvestre]